MSKDELMKRIADSLHDDGIVAELVRVLDTGLGVGPPGSGPKFIEGIGVSIAGPGLATPLSETVRDVADAIRDGLHADNAHSPAFLEGIGMAIAGQGLSAPLSEAVSDIAAAIRDLASAIREMKE